MPGDGKALEQLISNLERALGHDDNVIVESHKRVLDKITGKKREHDVVLTLHHGHHRVRVAIECRDRSRPITVNQIESFWKKCQDTGIDKGVLVSTTGFYNTAREKADFLDIRCLDIEEVAAFNWLLAPGIHALERKLLRHEWLFHPTIEGIADHNNMEVTDNNGNILTADIMASNAIAILNQLLPEIPAPVENSEASARVQVDNLVMRNIETNETCPIDFVLVKIRYQITEKVIPFKLVQYKEEDQSITDAAIAELQIGDISGKLMMVGAENGGKKIIYVPDKTKA